MAVDFPSKYQGDRLNHAGVRRPPGALAYTLVNHTGSGFLAGSFPYGITSIEGQPTPAEVRVLYRPESGLPGDGTVVAITHSAPDGTWRVDGLNPRLKYDVIGRKDGFNDVIVAGVTPTSMVDITYAGAVVENETFTGAVGFLELVGGIPPYSVAAETPFPSGLFPIVDGHKLIVDGTTDADEVASFDVKVTSSNGAEKIIPLQLVVGFKAPANFKAETVVVDDVFSVSLTWETTNSTQQIRVYRSVTQFDMDDLPEPIATLSGTSTKYADDDVIEDDLFYYMVTAVCEQYELRSNVIAEDVRYGDPYWDNVVALLHFDGDLVDNAGKVTWLTQSGASFSANSAFGVGMSLSVPGINSLSASSNHPGLILSDGSDFTIEAWINITSTVGHKVVVGKARGGIQSYFLSIAGDKLSFNISTNGSGGSGIRSFSTQESIPINTWCLIGVVKHNNDLHLFIDGELCATHTIQNTWYNTSQVATIGWHNVSGWNYPFKGFIDELRITKGVARYTESFTPPTKPFLNK